MTLINFSICEIDVIKQCSVPFSNVTERGIYEKKENIDIATCAVLCIKKHTQCLRSCYSTTGFIIFVNQKTL